MEGDLVLRRRAEDRLLGDVSKRAIDIAIAAIGLAVTSWLMLVIAVAVKCSSPGPVFFGHERRTRYGRTFTCWKFRTMRPGAEGLVSEEHRARFSLNYKLQNDDRVAGRVGRFLRKSSLDEIPQLWCVLRGEMSIVGPRPVTMQELTRMYREHAATILSVRPGLTGLWQVSGRSNLSYADRIALDLQYVDAHCFLMDLKIILRTPGAVFSSRGAL